MSTESSYLLSLWAPVLIACLLIGVLLGFGRRLRSLHQKYYGDVQSGSIGIVVASLLGLLAFLLAFTFGMAATRYEDRRQAVLAEANVIGTAYLRSDLLSEQRRSETRQLLRRYVEIRSNLAAPNIDNTSIKQIIEQSVVIHQALWRLAVNAAKDDATSITGLFVQATNDLIDAHSNRVMLGTQSTIPIEIWICLYAVAVISLGLTGFQWAGNEHQSVYPFMALVLAFAAVLTLVADLDDPAHGFIRTDQALMLELLQSLRTQSEQS